MAEDPTRLTARELIDELLITLQKATTGIMPWDAAKLTAAMVRDWQESAVCTTEQKRHIEGISELINNGPKPRNAMQPVPEVAHAYKPTPFQTYSDMLLDIFNLAKKASYARFVENSGDNQAHYRREMDCMLTSLRTGYASLPAGEREIIGKGLQQVPKFLSLYTQERQK